MMVEAEDLFKMQMVNKLVNYDWSRPTHNLFTTFFDDAVTLFSSDIDIIREFNRREKEFIRKYGLTIAQAEIRVFQRLIGQKKTILIHRKKPDINTYGERSAPEENYTIVSWFDLVDDLRGLKVWTIQQIKRVSESMDINLS